MNPSFCTECGGKLTDNGNGYLVCPNCGSYFAMEQEIQAPVYDPQPPKKSGGKKLVAVIIAIAVVIALVLGIVLVVVPMLEDDDDRTSSSGSRRDDDEDEEDEDEEDKKDEKGDEGEEGEEGDAGEEEPGDPDVEEPEESEVPEVTDSEQSGGSNTVEPQVTEEETEPAPTQTADPLAELEVGDTFTFGLYEQDNNFSNGMEPIQWLVLAREDDRILVISLYALDSRQYHSRHASVTWEDCDIRVWLNDDFCGDAFNEAELAKILTTTIPADANPQHGTGGGEDTQDRVFLLSVEEAYTYFAVEGDRHCESTAYAVSQGAFVSGSNGGSWWFLRTPGYDTGHISNVNSNGSIDLDGAEVESGMGAIRPAMWISIG